MVQPAYGSPKAATTTSGAETTSMFWHSSNALGFTLRAAEAAGLPAYGRKMTKVARVSQQLKALAPMLVTEAGIVRLANELHPLKARGPIVVIESGMLIDFTFALALWSQSFNERSAVPSGMSTATLTNELHP